LVEEWAHKTVLLTTNQLSLLTHPRVSRIIVLQQGTVVQVRNTTERRAVGEENTEVPGT
jgi:ABC-type transport system involved in cytochrome bd biosynthesis fused ATPase/permease subunit